MAHSPGKRRLAYRGNRQNRRDDRGSSSIEFAAVLPMVAIALLAIVQVSLVVWDQLRLAHAAREGARVLAVSNDPAQAKEAVYRSGDFDEQRLAVEIGPESRPAGTPSSVTVRYTPVVVVPYIARFVPPVVLTASVWIRVERDPP